LELELAIEGIEFEVVMVKFAGRGTRTVVTNLAEVVAALESAIR
jgi:hypothetical protein